MRLDRYGILPMLAGCGGLIFLGMAAMNWLVNNVWLVPTGEEAFEGLRRAVVEGRADANALMEASDYGLIVLFLIAVWIVGFGLTLPFVYFVNRRIRIARNFSEATTQILLRQTAWLGLWLAICVLLQMNRLFNMPVAMMVLMTFGLIETLLLVRRKSAETRFSDFGTVNREQ